MYSHCLWTVFLGQVTTEPLVVFDSFKERLEVTSSKSLCEMRHEGGEGREREGREREEKEREEKERERRGR